MTPHPAISGPLGNSNALQIAVVLRHLDADHGKVHSINRGQVRNVDFKSKNTTFDNAPNQEYWVLLFASWNGDRYATNIFF